jgi:UDP-glucose 4-epimerase
VTDIADAHVHALHYLLVGGGSVALNLANSRNYSVLEVVNMAENVCGRPVKVDIAPRRAGDPSVPIGDAK